MNSVTSKEKGIRLYNLFPRLTGNIARWISHLNRAKDMGFNAIYLNPFHYPGFSGSLYSPKDYYKYNPMFIDSTSKIPPTEQLRSFIKECHDRGLLFVMDLVINHTAIDCPLVQEHKNWYKLDHQGKVVHPGAMHDGKWHEWGDLAKIDNLNSSDRDNLWSFWWTMMSTYLDLGVDGFRCDMAYQVPGNLWSFLIGKSREKRPGCLFLAESLGCDFVQVVELAHLGFDYLFSSIKYWDYNEPWAMEQYKKTSGIVPSIGFPESHDTDRLIHELEGDLQAVKRQLLLSALFCKGYMIPIGFEFGFKRALNVVKTDPTWWEDTDIDLSGYIKQLNIIKDSYRALNSEEGLEVVDQDNWVNVFCLKRSLNGDSTVFVAINKDRKNHQRLFIPALSQALGTGRLKDISPEFPMNELSNYFEYWLRPSEVKILVSEPS